MVEPAAYFNICTVCFSKIEGWYLAAGFICEDCGKLSDDEKIETAKRRRKEVFGKKNN